MGQLLGRTLVRSIIRPPVRPIIRLPVRSFVVFDVDNTLYTRKHKAMQYMTYRNEKYREKYPKKKNETFADEIRRVDFISEGAVSKCIKPSLTELHKLHTLFESLTKTLNLKIWTFSNGSNKHVSDVLDVLKITDYFDGHINLTSISDKYNKYDKYISKPSQKAYQIAEDEMKFNKDFDKIYFIDDHNKNIEASIKRKNWISILVDEKGTRSVDGALKIKSINELKYKIPELFIYTLDTK
uniref:Haloacid dehalogenase-like hydrolase n=1 Tax=Mimivirus LCMiAC02 TaxID=2506609 RepID=A0A4D5XEQ0_9VIRU|nr:MAG: haloacid dehalogenase-like hydrolase [Mimivirus LCMiAC02]